MAVDAVLLSLIIPLSYGIPQEDDYEHKRLSEQSEESETHLQNPLLAN